MPIHYCDLGPNGVRIKTNGRHVPQFTAFKMREHITSEGKQYWVGMPSIAYFNAHSIISEDDDGNLRWFKNRNASENAMLTDEERKKFFYQKLASVYYK